MKLKKLFNSGIDDGDPNEDILRIIFFSFIVLLMLLAALMLRGIYYLITGI